VPGLLRKFFGSTASEGAAFALGTAVGPSLRPAAQEVTNQAWRRYPTLPIDAMALAAGVAQGQVARSWAESEALNSGIDGDRFGRLVDIANSGPGIGEAFTLWRRGEIDAAGFRRALKRAGLEDEWINAMQGAKDVLLTPAELANGRQQGFVTVERQHAEAAQQGITAERADVQFDLSGDPLPVGMMQTARNRGLVTDAEFAQAIREGHTKTKYLQLADRLRHPVLTASQYATLRLKGWLSKSEAAAGGALTGHTAEQMEQLWLSMGRPIAPVQAFTAAARGAPGPYGGTFGRADFDKAIEQSSIRPEYAETLWGTRFAYPAAFQLGRAVQSGAITAARARVILKYERYEPQDIDALVSTWSTGAASKEKELTASMLATEYQGRFITRPELLQALQGLGYNAEHATMVAELADAQRVAGLRNGAVTKVVGQYVNHRLHRAEAAVALDRLGVPPAARDEALAIADVTHETTRLLLTPAQIKKAFTKSIIDRATAVLELEDRGMSAADVDVFLAE
jgi:hypothetical protein